jgi:hypothetical protein
MSENEEKTVWEYTPKRNVKGSDTVSVTVTLPKKDMEYISGWAREKNVTLSRAIHNHIWMAYHAQKGDYRDYDMR